MCETIKGATFGKNHFNYEVTDPHGYHKEDTVPPVETGPKRPRILTVRMCTPLNGDDVELNEEGPKPHDDPPDERYKHGTELATMSVYPETLHYSAEEHGGPENCKATDPPAKPVAIRPKCHKDKAKHRTMPNETDN